MLREYSRSLAMRAFILILRGRLCGGLVGGLYAARKSADQLQDVTKTIGWLRLLGGQTPR